MRGASRRAGRRRALVAVVLCLALLGLIVVRRSVVPDAGTESYRHEDARVEKGGARNREGGDSDAAAGASGKGAAEAGRGDAAVPTEGGKVSAHVAHGGVGAVARNVLAGYEESSGCVLVRSGYVDLLGSVWSCTVVGGDWVDTVVVRARKDGRTCEVKTVRMDASAWEREAEAL